MVEDPHTKVDLELTGHDLDPALDRVMIVDTHVPCGGLATRQSSGWNHTGEPWTFLPLSTPATHIHEERDPEQMH